jgi:4-O-beta-D-mannosyl-D-glucose phosphorylase
MIYTRPQKGFIETGDSGICAGFTASMDPAVIEEEIMVDPREYHTVREVKNGQGPAPIKTEKAGYTWPMAFAAQLPAFATRCTFS